MDVPDQPCELKVDNPQVRERNELHGGRVKFSNPKTFAFFDREFPDFSHFSASFRLTESERTTKNYGLL